MHHLFPGFSRSVTSVGVLFCALLVCHCAVSQEKSGTVVIASVTVDKAVVAADSREVDGVGKIISDNGCKILAFDNKALFAFSGPRYCETQSKQEIWNAQTAAINAYRRVIGQTKRPASKELIDAWDDEMLHHMNFKMCVFHPGPTGEVMAAFMFSVNVLNVVDGYMDVISLNGKVVKTSKSEIPPDGLPVGGGVTGILGEFLADATPRSKTWHAKLDKASMEQRDESLAQLTRKLDTSRYVGGNIDVAVLTPSGIKWMSAKKECQNQQH
jgi:hypothetical protein